MTLTISADPVPLRVDEHGTIRVAGTRLTLETILAVYHQGKTAEQVVGSFDGVTLADVHAVLAYYLHHQAEIESYMAAQEQIADAVQRDLEARQGPSPLRQRLQRVRFTSI